jgi:hypothetical protein
MNCRIKGMITSVTKSKKNNDQYINMFDLEEATQFSVVSKNYDFTGVPLKVPVTIECELVARQFNRDGKNSTVLYVDKAQVKKDGA